MLDASNLFQYAIHNFFPTVVCLVWPLEASGGPNEPKCMCSGRSQIDIIAMYHSCARVSPPTILGEVSRQLWTKSDF